MRTVNVLFFLFFFQQSFGQSLFQLAPPVLKYNSAFFSGGTSFEVIFNQPGSEIRYTLNGNEPTGNDLLYSGAVAINVKTVVKVKTFGKDFLPSETVIATFIKNGKAIKNIEFSKPNESYANARPDILNDNIGGILNYRSGTWLGYDSDSVTIHIDLAKKEAINTILISMLQDENSWIFMPEELFVYYFDDKQKMYLPAGKEIFSHKPMGSKQCNIREIKPAPGIISPKIETRIITA